MIRVVIGLFFLLLTAQVQATRETWHFRDEAQEQQFHEITSALRCPKCQNTSIADSDAMIASDMRKKVFELMQEGKSHSQITTYMVSRYGYFVSYEPPIIGSTIPLWLVPSLFILAGIVFVVLRTRRRIKSDERLSDDERIRLQVVLNKGSKK